MEALSWWWQAFKLALITLFIIAPHPWWLKLITFVIVYILIIFLTSRLIIPHLGFHKQALPERLSPELERAVQSIDGETQEERLEQAYTLVTSQFTSFRDPLQLHFGRLFWKDHNQVWREGGQGHCNTQNLFLRLFLVRSGTVKDEDIQLVSTTNLIMLHQVMKVRLEKGWVWADPWGTAIDLPLGRRRDYFFKQTYNPALYNGLYMKL